MARPTIRSAARRGRPRKTAEHRTPRKEEILDVAAALFAEHGFEAVSLADIATAVGLSKTTLYHYFERKEQILGTLVVATIRQLNEFVASRVPAEAAADAKLIAFMEAQAEFFERHRTHFKVLLTQIGSLTDPTTRDAAVEWRVHYENTIRRIMQEGVASGLFSAERPNSVVRAVLASLYWLVRWYRPDGSTPARVIAREYAQVVLYGVAARRVATQPAAPGEV
jgi:TetR/AcrR family transcriptional regulator, cholesterol catabolism regulator